MSRIGKKPIELPEGVEGRIENGVVYVKGPKAELSEKIPPRAEVKLENRIFTVSVPDETDVQDRAYWGLTQRLIDNMVTGVTQGYEKKLEVNGVGYKVAMQGKDVKLDVGFSHDVVYPIPEGITASVEKNVIIISGASKQQVGEVAAQIRKVRKPEPYKGKGIKYLEEIIQRKAGKAAKSA